MTNKILYPTLPLFLALALSPPICAGERQDIFPVTAQQMQAMSIQVKALQQNAEPVVLSAPAQVTVPINRQQVVSASLPGLVLHVLVQPNQLVKQGDPLVKIASQEFGALQLQWVEANNRVKLARKAAEREKSLFDEGVIAQRRVQETQAALADSEAALTQAKAALNMIGLSQAAITRIGEGKLEEALVLVAPQSGAVTELAIKPGQRLEPMTALMNIAQTDKLALDIQVPSGTAAAWTAGAPLTLQGHAGTGKIVSASPVVSAGSQSVYVHGELDAKDVDVRSGQLVTVQLPLPADKDSWDIPLAAVVYDAAEAHVFVRTNEGFEARPVKVIMSAGQRVRVQGSIKAGDAIAVTGVIALKGSWLGEKGGE
ncbi:MAG TPA: efflux RND transporter periplasmic adaptor subunit [Cellvibrionaceae bacterium]|nr:efflux RND transporter periplasmic adaptor subunit [Cellvibrionaceae bacterium]HMY40327.1 efflux RND transporter periplasmic adaptor subunit [Marinagarivorans sp.]HNG61426.1 efflux RND transporter periplasmic adaptor subunit [Cellvibrionaceae bacterium]